MLFPLLANLIIIYSLLAMPAAASYYIDVSGLADQGEIEILKDNSSTPAPLRKDNSSLGMVISAKAAIVLDKKSNKILWQKNPDAGQAIASLTKLLTVLVFLDHNPGWEKEVTIEKSDYREGGVIKLAAGEKTTVRDLFNASLVVSSNNATMALVRSTGLTEEEFVKAINQKAQELGMTQSVFLEPTGLSPNNLSTARDISRLAQAAFSQEEIRQATIQKKYTLTALPTNRQQLLESTNKLLGSYLNVQAGKTGYLEEAGYCLVSEIKGPLGQEIIIVVLGSSTEGDRFQDLKALAQWTFDNYRWD